jgi:hypothetical protein
MKALSQEVWWIFSEPARDKGTHLEDEIEEKVDAIIINTMYYEINDTVIEDTWMQVGGEIMTRLEHLVYD